MASGEDDHDDLTEEERRRQAEADELYANSHRPRYSPSGEASFFTPSSADRAERARRAANRVRRRPAEGEEPIAPSDSIVARALDTKLKSPKSKPEPVETPSRPSDADVAQNRGSIVDRVTGLSGVAKQAAEKPKPEAHDPERLTTGSGSIMDRAVQNPVTPTAKADPETPAKPETKQGSSASASLMDRAMTRPVSPPKPAEQFEPKAVLSVAAKPLKPPIQKPAPVPRPTNRRGAKAVKDSSQALLSARLQKLAESKAPRSAPVDLVSKVSPASRGPAKEIVRKPTVSSPSDKTVHVEASAVSAPATPSAGAADRVYADGPAEVPDVGIRTAETKAFAPFEWMIASRYLRARKKEGFVSVIAGFSLVGIALGVATLIVVMAVMTGFRDTLVTQIIGGSPHINVYSQSDTFENYDALADQIRVVDGVTNVTPVVQGQVLGTGNQRHTGVIVRGMRKSDLERLIANAEPEVVNGTLENFTEDKGVALGSELAAKLGLRVGDFITLISPDGDITPFQATPMPRVKDYKIIQTFKLGVQEIDYGVAFMPFAEAQIYFNKQGQADTLDVFVDDPQSVSGSLRNIEPGSYEDDIFQSARSSISVNNWKNLNGRLIGAINLERQVMFVILTMIILVAALNIISGLVMLVKDKARDVAIMRTMGMARGSVLRIFFICGSSIGVIGSIAGVILGVLFVWNIHTIQGAVEWITGTRVWDPSVRAGITEIPTKLQFSDVALTLFIALGLSFIATLFPAWKAAKLDPVEALRYE